LNFASIPFIILLSLVILAFVLIQGRTGRKYVLLAASLIFYVFFDWRCLILVATYSAIVYFLSIRLLAESQKEARKKWLVTGIIISLLFLGFFKYYNFFIDSFNTSFAVFGWRLQTLNIIVPLGISFITFEGLSYLIDMHRGAAKPAGSWLDFALFMGFFPRVVSGPIVRAAQFLPQMQTGIVLNRQNMLDGFQKILTGCLKKLVVADSLAMMTNILFTSPSVFSSQTVWISVLAYSIEIYFDFSGYTDIAVGIAKILGITLPENFNLPYTSQSVTEFWRRWHMTLSAWFRDYVFYPLERNRSRKALPAVFQHLNTMAVFLLTGLWHGASWNFVLWGGLYGLYLVIERIFNLAKTSTGKWTSPVDWIRALITFLVVSVTWVFFRSPTFGSAVIILQKLLFINQTGLDWFFSPAVWVIPVVVIVSFLARQVDFRLPELSLNKSYTWALLFTEILIIFFFMATDSNPFIYFQF